MKPSVLPCCQAFKRLSYGVWAAIWTNWFPFKDLDTYNEQDILFLRGHVNYRPASEVKNAMRYQDSDSFLDVTGHKKQNILERTSVFIPITVSYNAIGFNFEGDITEDEIQLRAAESQQVTLLVNRFPRSRYRIEFGSEEPSDYSTRSVYDITVYPDRQKKSY